MKYAVTLRGRFVKDPSMEGTNEYTKKIHLNPVEVEGVKKLMRFLAEAPYSIEKFEGIDLIPDKTEFDAMSKYREQWESELDLLSSEVLANDYSDDPDINTSLDVTSLAATDIMSLIVDYMWRYESLDDAGLEYILKCFMHGIPLTALTNDESEWPDRKSDTEKDPNAIAPSADINKRYRHLIRDLRDGKYYDVKRFKGYDVLRRQAYEGGFVIKRLHELFPITFPYLPDYRPANVFSKTFSTHGSIATQADTLEIIKVVWPSGKTADINEYWDISDPKKPAQITRSEYNGRVKRFKKNRAELKAEMAKLEE